MPESIRTIRSTGNAHPQELISPEPEGSELGVVLHPYLEVPEGAGPDYLYPNRGTSKLLYDKERGLIMIG